MNDFYTILIRNDHTCVHTNVRRILYRSNQIDQLRFLVDATYNDLDMSKVNTVLEYVTPVSKTYHTVVLTPEEELYKGKVQYLLPITLDLTSEVGNLEFTINFSYLSMNDDGTFKEQVRPIAFTSIQIEDTKHWSDYIPDAKLDNIAQMMLLNQSCTEQNRINIELLKESQVANIKHDTTDNSIYLTTEEGNRVGDAIPVKDLDACDCGDGIPAVDFSETESPDIPDNNQDENVVEF